MNSSSIPMVKALDGEPARHADHAGKLVIAEASRLRKAV
jgi:hypothetical protein